MPEEIICPECGKQCSERELRLFDACKECWHEIVERNFEESDDANSPRS